MEDYNSALKLRGEGLGNKKISRILNIHPSTIENWISGRVPAPYLFCRRIRRLKPEMRQLSSNLAYILGVMAGDGTTDRGSVRLWTIDEDFALKFKVSLEEWSGYTCKVCKDERTHPNYRQGFCWVVKLYSKEIRNFLKNFDNSLILYGSRDIKVNFLKGFYDSEGWFCKRNKVVRCCNKNPKKIELVKALLTGLGIKIGKVVPRKDGLQYIPIYKRNTERFFQEVGFTIRRKQNLLEAYVQSIKKVEES